MRYKLLPVTMAVLALVLLVTGCGTYAREPLLELGAPVQRAIIGEVQGMVFHYQEQLTWSQEDFALIQSHPDNFTADVEYDFAFGLQVHSLTSEGIPEAENMVVSIDAANNTTLLTADVLEAISTHKGKYWCIFRWLLEPLGAKFNFLHDDFQASAQGLSWNGTVGEIPTTIVIKLPQVDNAVYTCWREPAGYSESAAWWALDQ